MSQNGAIDEQFLIGQYVNTRQVFPKAWSHSSKTEHGYSQLPAIDMPGTLHGVVRPRLRGDQHGLQHIVRGSDRPPLQEWEVRS